MKTKIKTIGMSFALAAMLSSPLSAGSVAGFGGATEVTQTLRFSAELGDRALSYAKQIQQYQQQVQQYINQYKSYEMMLMNIGKLPQRQWDSFQSSVTGLKSAIEFGDALAYTAANLDNKFNDTYQGYDKWLAAAKSGNFDFGQQYRDMSAQTRDTVHGALKSLNLQEENMKTDEGTLKELEVLSQSASGQLGAIQAANAIATHQAHTLKRLQKTMMTQANVQAQFIANKNEKTELADALAAAKRGEDIPLGQSKNMPGTY